MTRIVVFTGAGISAESGLRTFRGADGLWEGYRLEDVATPEAWKKNPELVQRFYNERRQAVLSAEPNAAHFAIAELQTKFNVCVVTQNIDDLHERAGSKNIIHLHGEIRFARSSVNSSLIYPIEGHELRMGQTCELGSQLRPHVVWFGEAVPMIEPAISQVKQADIMIVVGTSLMVYPAASLVDFLPTQTDLYLIDPDSRPFNLHRQARIIKQTATRGAPALTKQLLSLT